MTRSAELPPTLAMAENMVLESSVNLLLMERRSLERVVEVVLTFSVMYESWLPAAVIAPTTMLKFVTVTTSETLTFGSKVMLPSASMLGGVMASVSTFTRTSPAASAASVR